MTLKSRIFKGDPVFEACLVNDSAHIKSGAHGKHVAKIQAVIMLLDGAQISEGELNTNFYGPSTALAVLNYKKKRKIINFSYQTQADNIVGKMTIKTIDEELERRQEETKKQPPLPCRINSPSNPNADQIARLLVARKKSQLS
jgi:hypothetical protein